MEGWRSVVSFGVCELGVSGCDLWGGAFGAAEVSRWCLAVLLGRLACRDRVIVGYVVSRLSCGCSSCYWFGYCCV